MATFRNDHGEDRVVPTLGYVLVPAGESITVPDEEWEHWDAAGWTALTPDPRAAAEPAAPQPAATPRPAAPTPAAAVPAESAPIPAPSAPATSDEVTR